ncbi:MAG TPA: terminase [Firmicutes bacterium]|nr:terminase [Bacillota bacterium]
MGRNAKPIALHLVEGNPNRLTKAEIERRKKAEIKVGTKKFKVPTFVKEDPEAYKKWKEVIKLYKEVDFVSSGDVGMIARYCMVYSEYLRAVERKKTLENATEGVPLVAGPVVDNLIKLDNLVNKKMDALMKMEDRLFLNPLAKVKNVPKKEKKPERDPLKERGFGNV